MSAALLRALEQHARLRPAALALEVHGAGGVSLRLSWRELFDGVRALAPRLHGLEREVVLVALPNGAELWFAVLAGIWAGAWLLPVSPELHADGLAQLAHSAGARAAIAPRALLEQLPGIELRLASEDALALALAPAAGREAPQASAAGALLLRTSATTGAPRIARRAVSALEASGDACRKRLALSPADRMLLAIPAFHAYGLEQGLFAATLSGCAVELHSGFDPRRARASLSERGTTIWPAVPVMLDAVARAGATHAPSLRRVYTAGSPLPRRVAEAFARSCGVRVGQIYGATEFGGVTFNDPDDADYDPEVAGRPFDGFELRICACDGPPGVPLAPGSEGQIAVAGPALFAGYLGDAAAAALDRFALSGDLGRIDERGRLRVVGRLQLLIDVGAFKVNPAEVEAVLMGHPKVREAVVLPLAYTDTASRVRAVVIPEPSDPPSRSELRAFARARLLPYQVPRSFEIRADVPRSSTGKILRSALAGTRRTPVAGR